jgi:hypothetical protein
MSSETEEDGMAKRASPMLGGAVGTLNKAFFRATATPFMPRSTTLGVDLQPPVIEEQARTHETPGFDR